MLLAQSVDALPDDWELVGAEFSWQGIVFLLLLTIALFIWCLTRPEIGRMVARSFAVVAVGLGVGWLTWGICAAALGDPKSGLSSIPLLSDSPTDAIGVGAGLLAGGILALVLSFLPRRCDRQSDDSSG